MIIDKCGDPVETPDWDGFTSQPLYHTFIQKRPTPRASKLSHYLKDCHM